MQDYPLIGYNLPKSVSRGKAKKYRKLLAKARFSDRAKRVRDFTVAVFEHKVIITACPGIDQ